MSQPSIGRAQSERVGIWTIAILVVVGAIWAVIRYVPKTAPGTAPPSSVTAISPTDHTQGKGKVTLIEYADFQCPACKTYYPIVKQLMSNYADRVVFVYRYFPLTQIHQNAEISAKAAEAASQQGKFWEMHDKLFEGQESWAEERNPEVVYESYAKDIGLDVEQFKKDMAGSEIKARIDADVAGGTAANINATPTFYLNGQYLESPQTYDNFRTAVDHALQS